jgi:hypothetical protein
MESRIPSGLRMRVGKDVDSVDPLEAHKKAARVRSGGGGTFSHQGLESPKH